MLIINKNWTMALKIQFILEIIIFAIGYYYLYKKETNKKQLIYKSLFYFYIIGVLFVTILPLDFQFFQIGNFSYFNANNFFHPFEDLLMHRSGALKGIILNIIMLIPFGLLYPLVLKKNTFFKTLTTGILFILGIEITQMICSLFSIGFRTFDITDVLTNILGLLIGYMFYLLAKKTNDII